MIYEFTRTITWCDVTSLVIRETINCLKVRGPGPGVRLHVSGHVSHAPPGNRQCVTGQSVGCQADVNLDSRSLITEKSRST